MKTNAPGPFSCEIYLKSWQLGYRTGDTKLHIDNCYFCGPIVHGGTEDFPLSAADQAKKNIADRKRASRRRFFTRTAAAASIAGITAIGFKQFVGESKTAAPNGIATEIAVDFASLDTLYATLGRTKIESLIANGTPDQAVRTVQWIQDRKHASMYDLACVSLAAGNKEVQKAAFVVLGRIGHVALKPHLQLIAETNRRIKRRELRIQIARMLVEIEAS